MKRDLCRIVAIFGILSIMACEVMVTPLPQVSVTPTAIDSTATATEVPQATPHVVSLFAVTALNIREGRGIEYRRIREVPEGTYLFAICYPDGWCFDREQAGWFCLEAAVSGGGCDKR